ncbi:hypothetical protein HPO96_07285 [Kribbella sandramycini]|uniref:DUF4352 domain-containing protein n=1 Tax=Kribbella sandramycini TaxID=60450 RepID=A0A7Y4KWN0_9ACTN|nr:hypothetical protein [Kribbella sandramycini]MBB6567344.1 hypothetical protein [Kribbella sandramycini]NOL40043.1 hypothetical protein [Kribbella sandramycini]
MSRRVVASTAISLIVASVTVLSACSKVPQFDPNAPVTPHTPAAGPTKPTLTPHAPPTPEPAVAKVGGSIKVYELGTFKPFNDETPKWSAATITLRSFRITKTVPGIPAHIKPDPGKVYASADIRTLITADPFTLWQDHFKLVAPDGTEYDQDANAAYLPNDYNPVSDSKPLTNTKNPMPPGSGILLFQIPPTLPAGTKLTAELWKNHPFSWQVA